MPSGDDDHWFRQITLGRFEVIHWKGWAAFLAFLPIAFVGMGLETWLKQIGSYLLYYAVMIPFGIIVIGCAAYVAGKIDRS